VHSESMGSPLEVREGAAAAPVSLETCNKLLLKRSVHDTIRYHRDAICNKQKNRRREFGTEAVRDGPRGAEKAKRREYREYREEAGVRAGRAGKGKGGFRGGPKGAMCNRGKGETIHMDEKLEEKRVGCDLTRTWFKWRASRAIWSSPVKGISIPKLCTQENPRYFPSTY
jgi:hypothetical protein